MKYYFLLMILFNSSGEIRDIIHLDTIFGKEPCVTQMDIEKVRPGVKKGTWFSCVPIRTKTLETLDDSKAA